MTDVEPIETTTEPTEPTEPAAPVTVRRRRRRRPAAGPDAATPADLERGYRVTRWHGLPNFECVLAPFASLDEDKVIQFVKRLRRHQ